MALVSDVFGYGLAASRPTDNSALTVGRWYFTSDTGRGYRDNGATWDEIFMAGDVITVAGRSGVVVLTSADIGGLAEAVDDRVAALLVAGTGVTLTYNDGANTLTIDAAGGSSLQVQDEGGAALPAHPYLNFVGGKVAAYEDVPNDAVVVQIDANVIIPTPAVAGQVTYFVDIDQIGGHTGFTYNDATGQLSTGYLELAAITAPSAPASGFVRLYVDVADGHVKFKKNGGAVVDLG